MEAAPLSPSPLILAIETSCDETAAAVVRGREVRSNVVASQISLHAAWGGVVPEAAARAHVEALLPTLDRALSDAETSLDQIEVFAVTDRPGLVGALSVGVTAAHALAFSRGSPLVGVHHIEGHLASVLPQRPPFPLIALVVSGGHTELLWLESPVRYRLLGETRDDAAGEAMDKSARLLGFAYPGGRALSELARIGDPARYRLPRALGENSYEMSFSGLKTAVRLLVEREGVRLDRAGLAASVQATVARTLVRRLELAFAREGGAALAVVGGVAANEGLRAAAAELAARLSVPLFVPPPELCTDNAAMIGLAASARWASGEVGAEDVEARAVAPLPGLTEPEDAPDGTYAGPR